MDDLALVTDLLAKLDPPGERGVSRQGAERWIELHLLASIAQSLVGVSDALKSLDKHGIEVSQR